MTATPTAGHAADARSAAGAMSPRRRALAVLSGREPDRIPWFGDLSYWVTELVTEKRLSPEQAADFTIPLHRELGIGYYLQGYWPFTPTTDGIEIATERSADGRITTTTVTTPIGQVRESQQYLPESYTWGYTEHFVKNVDDLAVLRYWYEHLSYQPNYAHAEAIGRCVGEDGFVLCYLPRSPLMQMVVQFAGIEATTYAWLDDPDQFDATIAVLRRKADEAAALAVAAPADILMIPENLSSELIGKDLYNSYMRPYQEYWIERIHAAGRFSCAHMDGTLAGLLPEMSSVGFSFLEALTPAPVGDLSLPAIRAAAGETQIIWGGLPGALFCDQTSDADFDAFVIDALAFMRQDRRFILGVADQVPPGTRPERIARVAELVEQFG